MASGSTYVGPLKRACMLAALSIGIYFALSRLLIQSAEPVAPLSICHRSRDLGHVWERADFRWIVPILNTSLKSVDVLNVSASCACVSVSPRAFTVPAGGTVDVVLSLDLRKPGDASTVAEAFWPFEVKIVPIVGGSFSKHDTWTLTGKVQRSPFVLSTTEVDFGESLVYGSAFSPRYVRVKSAIPFSDLQASCDPSIATVSIEHIIPSSCYQLKILPHSTLAIGEHEFVVHLRSHVAQHDLPAGIHEPPEFDVPVKATVVQSSYVVPGSLVFGVEEVGKTIEKAILVGLLETTGFSVSSQVDGHCSTTVQREQSDSACTEPKVFKVIQHIDHVGAYSGNVRFKVDVKGKKSQVIDLPISYHGIENPKHLNGDVSPSALEN